jgi:hypothetical protein
MGESHPRVHSCVVLQSAAPNRRDHLSQSHQGHKDFRSGALRLSGLNPVSGMGESHLRVHVRLHVGTRSPGSCLLFHFTRLV